MKRVCAVLLVALCVGWPGVAAAKGHAHHPGHHAAHHRAARAAHVSRPAHHASHHVGAHAAHHRQHASINRNTTVVYPGGGTYYGGRGGYYGGGRRYYGHRSGRSYGGYGYGGRGYGYSRRWRNARSNRYAGTNRNSTPLTSSQGTAQRLTASQLDPTTGKITWPDVLQANEYTPQRTELENLFAERAKTDITPKLTSSIRFEVDQMKNTLQTHMHGMPGSSYLAARKFLDSLAYEGTLPLKS
ncbi:MAG TPA: hypothetical protein VHB77_11275 [Planctomycetaceae bacterium]|nr:hypothetical protein [Planctomycetaceae bacterium]